MNSIPYITSKVNIFYKKILKKYRFYVKYLQGFAMPLFLLLVIFTIFSLIRPVYLKYHWFLSYLYI